MLDASGLTKDQQNVVVAPVGSSREFDEIAKCLTRRHADINVGRTRRPQKIYQKTFGGKA